MKVIVTEPVANDGLDILRNSGIDIEEKFNLSSNELEQIIGRYDAIITRSGTKITKDTLRNPGSLKVIGRAGTGLDNIDVGEASKKGIIVINAPGGNAIAAAELTIAMMLNTIRKIPQAYYDLKNNKSWNRKRFMGAELRNKILGIVGLGNVGSAVAARAKAFDVMDILAYDPYIKKSKADKYGVVLLEEFNELLRESDIITFHVPLTVETSNMVTEREINKMKDGVVLINCARGGIVNESDLYKALKTGKVSACAIDTFNKEPAIDNPLLELDNVVVTPHIGANSKEAQTNVSMIVCEQLLNVLLDRPYKNAVNIPFMKDRMSDCQQKYFELAESIGSFAAQLTRGIPKEFRITMVGKLFEDDFVPRSFDVSFNYEPYTIAAIKGYLKNNLLDSVSYMSAPYIARDNGIVIFEGKTKSYENYSNMIVLTITTIDGAVKEIGATVYEDGSKKIVFVDGFRTDIKPEGLFIYIINKDKPGIIGKIGTILGNHSINIAGFYLSRQGAGLAMSFVEVDDLVDDGVLNQLRNVNDIISVKLIRL